MQTPSIQNDHKGFSRVARSEINAEELSQNHSRSQLSSKSPLSRPINSSPSYFSSTSYQRTSNISPKHVFDQQQPQLQNKSKTSENFTHQRDPILEKQLQSNLNSENSHSKRQFRNLKDQIQQISILKSKIKEEEFLIELETAVHKELMAILSKKDKSLSHLKSEKFNPEACYQIQEQTQDFLDKAESYVQNFNKLSQMAQAQQN